MREQARIPEEQEPLSAAPWWQEKMRATIVAALASTSVAVVAGLLVGCLVYGHAPASAEAGDMFHAKPTKKAPDGLRTTHVAPIVAKAKGAIFSVSYKRSFPRYRRNRRRSNRYWRRFYRRYRKYRTPPTMPPPPDPFFRRRRGTTPPGWMYRGRRRARRTRRRFGGSGFVIHGSGYALTSARLLRRANDIKVQFANGKSYKAKVVGQFRALDVALLKIELPKGTSLPYVSLGSSAPLQIGETVIALGCDRSEGLQASTGILSSKGRHRRYGTILRTDAGLYRSQRGGPLLNHQGLVIGVIRSRSGYRGGIAHPIDDIRKVLPRLKNKGTLKRARLGVMVRAITPSLMRAFKLPSYRGALVAQVMKDSPADKAGLKPGDLIIRFNETPIDSFSALPQAVRLVTPGSTARIVFFRNGQRMTASATLAVWKDKDKPKAKAPTSRPAANKPEGNKPEGDKPEGSKPAARPTSRPAARPAPKKAKDALSRLGVSVQSISQERSKKLGLDGGGVAITKVKSGAPAAENGLQAGDVIAEVNRTPVKSGKHFLMLIDKVPSGDSVLLLVRRNNTALFVAFTLP